MADVSHEELMRFLDGEVDPRERARIEAAIAESTELQREVALFGTMKEDLRTLRFDTNRSRSVWYTVNRRLARPFGWVLLVVGFAVWMAYGSYLYMVSSIDPIEKLATSGIVLGLIILLASVIYERYRESVNDPYRDVLR